MSIKKTPLTEGQYIRLLNVLRDDEITEEPLEKNFVSVEGSELTKIELKFKDHEESIYLGREDFDFVKKEINLERD